MTSRLCPQCQWLPVEPPNVYCSAVCRSVDERSVRTLTDTLAAGVQDGLRLSEDDLRALGRRRDAIAADLRRVAPGQAR